jgi:hypothetical protein
MAQQIADRRDIDFVIWEQMKCEEILRYELYKEYNKNACEMIITDARALAIKSASAAAIQIDDDSFGGL